MRVSDDRLHAKLLGHLDDGAVPLLPIRLWVILECQPGHVPLLQRKADSDAAPLSDQSMETSARSANLEKPELLIYAESIRFPFTLSGLRVSLSKLNTK